MKKWYWRSDNEWDFEEPCKLTPALKGKTAVGMVTQSGSLKHKHHLFMLLLPFAKENPKSWSNFCSTNIIWLDLHVVVLLKSWQPEIGVLLWLWTSGHPQMEPVMLINSSSTQCLILYCHNSLKAVKAIPLSVRLQAGTWLEYYSICISRSSLAYIYHKRKFNCSYLGKTAG